jgi:hypothetical protein
MTKYIFTSVFVFSCLLLEAQVGLKVGGQLTTLGGYQDAKGIKSEVLPGWVAGVTFGGYRDKTSLRFEILFSQRGNEFTSVESGLSRDGSHYTLTSKYTNRLSYIEFPIMFTMPIVRHLRFEIGTSPSFCVFGNRSGETVLSLIRNSSEFVYTFKENANYFDDKVYPDYTQYIDKKEEGILYPVKRPLKLFDVTLNAGLSYQFIPQLAIQGRYALGVLDVFQNDYPVPNASSRREVHRVASLSLIYIINAD